MNNLLKVAKANHKQALKNVELYKKRRDELLRVILNSQIPNWGSFKITVSKL